jgi:uncharacterized NAD(P)/FAD-binding protein YdhS
MIKNSHFKWEAIAEDHSADRPFSVLIIGGGFSGTVLAYQLLRRDPKLDIAIVDSGEKLGQGIAYSTTHRCHVLNVPAKGMSALADDPEHFLRWARSNYDSNVRAEAFLPRKEYARYLESLLEETASLSGRNLPWFRDQALTLTRGDGVFSVQLKSGRNVQAKTVVIATGNVPPGDPSVPGLTDEAKRYTAFSWSQSALEGLDGKGDVLLIGMGLTSVDLAIRLLSERFAGTIHMLSRRGLLPQTHKPAGSWPRFWNEESPRTVRGMLRLIRNQVRSAAKAGIDWRSVVDALRPVTPEIWRSLPEQERKRFMRHARPYWDLHRHRVAPEISEQLHGAIRDGRVRVHAGRITHYREDEAQATVTLRKRRNEQSEKLHVDRVINCTGPEADWRRIDNTLLSSLFAQGLARPDSLFVGLDVDRDGCMLDEQGAASQSLFAIGPVRKGGLWETTAVPELRQQASDLADQVVRAMKRVYSDDEDLLNV